jgi:hypothetical protein
MPDDRQEANDTAHQRPDCDPQDDVGPAKHQPKDASQDHVGAAERLFIVLRLSRCLHLPSRGGVATEPPNWYRTNMMANPATPPKRKSVSMAEESPLI